MDDVPERKAISVLEDWRTVLWGLYQNFEKGGVLNNAILTGARGQTSGFIRQLHDTVDTTPVVSVNNAASI